MNGLTEECTQNCHGVRVSMNSVRTTATSSSTSTTSTNTKEDRFSSTLTSFKLQIKKSRVDKIQQIEIDIVQDSLSQHNNKLMFLKTEKYEAIKWVDHT